MGVDPVRHPHFAELHAAAKARKPTFWAKGQRATGHPATGWKERKGVGRCPNR